VRDIKLLAQSKYRRRQRGAPICRRAGCELQWRCLHCRAQRAIWGSKTDTTVIRMGDWLFHRIRVPENGGSPPTFPKPLPIVLSNGQTTKWIFVSPGL